MENRWLRSLLARIRTRTLGLRANKRWYEQNEDNDNVCLLCKKAAESEIHFVFQCSAYNDIRRKYDIFSLPVFIRQDICAILASKDERKVFSFAKFFEEAYNLRAKTMTP